MIKFLYYCPFKVAGTILYAAQLLESSYLKFTHEKCNKNVSILQNIMSFQTMKLHWNILVLTSAAFTLH